MAAAGMDKERDFVIENVLSDALARVLLVRPSLITFADLVVASGRHKNIARESKTCFFYKSGEIFHYPLRTVYLMLEAPTRCPRVIYVISHRTCLLLDELAAVTRDAT